MLEIDYSIKEKAKEILQLMGIKIDDVSFDSFEERDPTDPDQEVCIDLQRQCPFVAVLILVRDTIGKQVYSGGFGENTPGWVFFWKAFREFIFGALNAMFPDVSITSLRRQGSRLVACGVPVTSAPWLRSLKAVLGAVPSVKVSQPTPTSDSTASLEEFVKVVKF